MHLNKFISTYITKRDQSMFEDDIDLNRKKISLSVKNKSVLVIGGAGTIGSSYIRSILPFKPK